MRSQINTIIVEDDEQSLQSLKTAIKYNFNEINLLDVARNVSEGLEKINTLNPDLLILDIMLPDGYGFDILQHSTYNNYEVIITSSQPNYALQAYNFSALHFIEKPIKAEQFRIALDRYNRFRTFEQINDKIGIAKELLTEAPSKIMLPNDRGMFMYRLDDIIYFEADSNYVTVNFSNKSTELVTRTLHSIEDVLKDTQFYRIHNSYIINMKFIKAILKGRNIVIQLENGIELPISASKKDGLMMSMTKFVKFV